MNETATCEWNEMSTCERILDKRLKFRRWFLHVLTRHKENYTCRLNLNVFLCAKVRLTAERLTAFDKIILNEILRGFAEYYTS